MSVLYIVLLLVGVVMFLKPKILWVLTESWKSNDGKEPSGLYLFSTRFGGLFFLLAGLAGISTLFFA
ncbi:DUF6199 family natural product biosynthesis protein [Paenibacillus roseus]|uniref:DUF6199 domain-containing protein n=1 Tax=Paenibacillus roseus TaxID=2798579 RepID=A0A934J2M2_9BACL|nr:DUF6199 family natural product biosynthesis protein [Paenibacillus roseus]MBJ6361650.1 hypothetical protein [Paenibacillus roseus]